MDNYKDHAANERTFLAWIRTGIAVAAFGFVLEKFNLFIAIAESATNKVVAVNGRLGQFERYDSVALIAMGVVFMLIGYYRFAQDRRHINNQDTSNERGMALELLLTALLVGLSVLYCIFYLLH